MTENQANHVCILDCFHTAYFAPAPIEGDEVYCAKCGDYRKVVIASAEWRIKCSACRLGRAYGTDEEQARRAAGNHADRFRHDVKLILGGHPRETITGSPLPATLQWLKDHPEHQRSFRG